MYSTFVERVFSLIFPSSLQSPSAEVTAGGASHIPTAKIVKAKRPKKLRFPRAASKIPTATIVKAKRSQEETSRRVPTEKKKNSVEVYSCKEESFLYHGRKAMP